jgi:hypothetical protein
MATELPIDEAPESAGAVLTASPERADEIFLEGPRLRSPIFLPFYPLSRHMQNEDLDVLLGARISLARRSSRAATVL